MDIPNNTEDILREIEILNKPADTAGWGDEKQDPVGDIERAVKMIREQGDKPLSREGNSYANTMMKLFLNKLLNEKE